MMNLLYRICKILKYISNSFIRHILLLYCKVQNCKVFKKYILKHWKPLETTDKCGIFVHLMTRLYRLINSNCYIFSANKIWQKKIKMLIFTKTLIREVSTNSFDEMRRIETIHKSLKGKNINEQ